MAWVLVYEGTMSGTAIAAAMTAGSGAIVVPSANGQRVAILQGAAA
jgi:hypothetical protein